MFRRIYAVLLAGLIICISLPVVSQAEESDAWTMALALVEQEMGYSADELEKNNLVYSDGAWAFSVTIIDHPLDEDGLIVGEMDARGKKISLSGPSHISLEQQLVNDLKYCFNRDDCYLLLANVCSKWNERLANADDETLDGIWEKYLSVLKRGATTPTDDMLSYDTVYASVWKHLAIEQGWTEEMADMFRLTISAYYVLDNSPVYFFYFERHSYFEAAYSTDKAMNKYLNALNSAFSDIGQKPPLRIGVLIHAKTGELVERPMLDYTPSQFHYLDFFIRTDEAVRSITGGE